jgi:hypothetical protein
MKSKISAIVMAAVSLTVLGGIAPAAQNKFTLTCRMGSGLPSFEDTRHGRMSP